MISYANNLALIVLLTLSLQCQCYCPQPYKTYNESSCFYMHYSEIGTIDFNTAGSLCLLQEFPKINGHLASLDDVDQERWVVENLLSTNRRARETYANVWIGLKRIGSDFYWLDGNPSEYRNWEPDEPNNSNISGGTEDCVQIRLFQQNQGWNDLSCTDRIDGFICRTEYIKELNNQRTIITQIQHSNSTPEYWIYLAITTVVIFCILIFGILATCFFLRMFNWNRGKGWSTNREMSTFSTNHGNLNRKYVDWLNSVKSRVPIYPPEQLTVLKELGKGAFGVVYLVQYLRNNEAKRNDEHSKTHSTNLLSTHDKDFFAMKVLKNVTGEKLEDLEREMKIISALNHPNIVKFYGIGFTVDRLALLFEYMENGDLVNYLRKNSEENNQCLLPLTRNDLLTISCQIARGLDYLASEHLVHRDLAARNCLVGDKMLLKISDFGMTRDIYITDYYKMGSHTLVPVRWLPPESILYGKFTVESDVWSFGVLLWEIFSYGKVPWYIHSNGEILQIIKDGKQLDQPSCCPLEIYSLMLGCWAKIPNERLTANQLLTKLELILENKPHYCNVPDSVQELHISMNANNATIIRF